MKITIVGAGAIGGLAGAYMSKAGHDVTLTDRWEEHVKAMKAKGLYIDGVRGEMTVPVKALHLRELEGPLEMVLVATKSQHAVEAVQQLVPLMNPATCVVSFQNGFNEPAMVEALDAAGLPGAEMVIGSIPNYGGALVDPGYIEYVHEGPIQLGEMDGRDSPRTAELAEPLTLHGLVARSGLRGAVLEMLEAVELRPAADFADAFPSELSGGQLQRVAIARALIIKPRVVIADEPVSMLDVSIRSGVMNLMRGIQRDTGVTYLYITHDLSVARYMADRIAVMYLGAVLEEGPAEQIISAAAHPYTRLLIQAAPEHRATSVKRKRIRLPGDAASQAGLPDGCRFHPRCPLAQKICREKVPPPVDLGDRQVAACHFAEEVQTQGLAAAPADAS